MAAEERWYFTQESLQSTFSRKCGVDADKELSYRQQAANFIQDMGQRLPVNQLCINTAIVYMHRFYMFHSFSKFHRNAIATCALFLAAKVEEQPRKLEHVIKVAHMCLCREGPPLDTKSESYLEQAQQLVVNENIMLQTLGFDVAIDHPHTHIVKCCQLVRASKDLAQTSYIMATTSLHLTTMCLQYKPTVVACVCIHLACKWANWEIPYSSEGKDWFWYVDKNVTLDLLKDLTAEFLAILDKCPSRLKRKILSTSCGKDGSSSDKKLRADMMTPGSGLLSGFPSSSFSDKCGSPVQPAKNEQEINADQVNASTTAKVQRESGHHPRSSSTTELMRAMNGDPKTATTSPQTANNKRTRLEKNKMVSKEKKERSEKLAHLRIPTTSVKNPSPTTIRIAKSHSDKNVRHKTKEDVNHMPAPWSNGKESKMAENKSPLQLSNDARTATSIPQILVNAETNVSNQETRKVRTLTPENMRLQQQPHAMSSVTTALPTTTTPVVQARSTKIALTNCSPYDPKTKETNILTDVTSTPHVPTADQFQWTPSPMVASTTTTTERRHEKKHKHKNRDKVIETLVPPRIKLTIPKERIENKDSTRIKLKLSKERFAAPPPVDFATTTATSMGSGGDIPKLKIKIPKNKSNDSKKREPSPTNYHVSEAKIARMETRLSRRDDEQTQQQQQQQQHQQQILELQQQHQQQMMILNESLRHHKHKVTNLQPQPHQHYSRKNNKMACNSKTNPQMYHEMQMNAGSYPYSQYYPYAANYFAGECPPSTHPQFYPRPQAYHGAVHPPPLPRDPPPPPPPPPPE